jgi:hypothetical protein
MIRSMFHLRLCFLFILLAGLARAEELRVPVRDRDDFVLDLPEKWHSQTRLLTSDQFPEVMILNEDRTLQIHLLAIWSDPPYKNPTAEDLRKINKQTIELVRPRAVESEIELHELAAPGLPGCYFSATDRAPAPGGFKYLISGSLGLSELTINFSIATKEQKPDAAITAFAVIRSIRRAAVKKAPQLTQK